MILGFTDVCWCKYISNGTKRAEPSTATQKIPFPSIPPNSNDTDYFPSFPPPAASYNVTLEPAAQDWLCPLLGHAHLLHTIAQGSACALAVPRPALMRDHISQYASGCIWSVLGFVVSETGTLLEQLRAWNKQPGNWKSRTSKQKAIYRNADV